MCREPDGRLVFWSGRKHQIVAAATGNGMFELDLEGKRFDGCYGMTGSPLRSYRHKTKPVRIVEKAKRFRSSHTGVPSSGTKQNAKFVGES